MKGYEMPSGFPGPFVQSGSSMSTTTDHLDQVDTDPLHIVRWHDPLIDQLGDDLGMPNCFGLGCSAHRPQHSCYLAPALFRA